jgi:hypothetical protein
MSLFGLNKKYDIPLVIGAGVVGIMMLITGYKLAGEGKVESKESKGGRVGGKKTKSKKRHIRNDI